MIFGGIPPLAPLAPPGASLGGGYPKMKIGIIFEIPTIKNPRIDISHDFLCYRTQLPPSPSPKK